MPASLKWILAVGLGAPPALTCFWIALKRFYWPLYKLRRLGPALELDPSTSLHLPCYAKITGRIRQQTARSSKSGCLRSPITSTSCVYYRCVTSTGGRGGLGRLGRVLMRPFTFLASLFDPHQNQVQYSGNSSAISSVVKPEPRVEFRSEDVKSMSEFGVELSDGTRVYVDAYQCHIVPMVSYSDGHTREWTVPLDSSVVVIGYLEEPTASSFSKGVFSMRKVMLKWYTLIVLPGDCESDLERVWMRSYWAWIGLGVSWTFLSAFISVKYFKWR